jgi:hypothetical protein
MKLFYRAINQIRPECGGKMMFGAKSFVNVMQYCFQPSYHQLDRVWLAGLERDLQCPWF